jgi:hypothetical protein
MGVSIKSIFTKADEELKTAAAAAEAGEGGAVPDPAP